MTRVFTAVLLSLTLVACSNRTTPADPDTSAPVPDAAITDIAVVDSQTEEVLPGLASVREGSVVALGDRPTQQVQLQAKTTATTLSRVEFTFDGQKVVDETAPYTFPGPNAAGGWLERGSHTLSATPYSAEGAALAPLKRSFSVTAPDYHRYLYVFRLSAIDVFDIDDDHKLVKSLKLPGGIERIWGAAAHAASQRLYISYHGRDPEDVFETGLLAYDLVNEKVLWKKLYKPFVDSPAITPDGQTIYLSSGEATDRGDFWFVLAAADGSVKDTIDVFRGAHNTVLGLNSNNVYLESVRYPYLVVADTATNEVIREIGPFRAGVRPFTVNGKETLAYVNVNNFLGFEVGDLSTGKVLYSVPVEGFPERDFSSELDVQSHGVALTPDETEVWIADNGNKQLHLFDVRGVPERAPVYLTSLPLTSSPNWVQFSRDGRFAYSSGGEVIDVRSRTTIATTSSAKVRIQIDFAGDLPAQAYVRYGLGYMTR